MAILTDASVRALPAPDRGVRLHFDDALPGFAVRCSQGGAKAFVLTFGTRTTRRRVTIGRYPTIGLSAARTAAKRLLAEHTLGQHRSPRVPVADALQNYLAAKERTNRARTVKDTRRILNKYLSDLKNRNLDDITTHVVTRITDQLAQSVPGTARHAFCEMRTFFRWCVKRRLLQHSPLEGLEPPVPVRTRERVLSDDELCTVWRAAEHAGGHYGKIIMLLALTGQRRGEIAALQAEWLEAVGGEKRFTHLAHNQETVGPAPTPVTYTITIPSSHTKNSRTHAFPVCGMAAGLLKSHIPTNARTTGLSHYLFPARGNGSKPFNGWSKSKAQLDQLVDIYWRGANPNASWFTSWTLHDLRRTYATNLQRLGIRTEVIEALLNHVSGTKAGIVGVYQRHRWWDEMVEAVHIFEKWLLQLIRERSS